MIFAFIVTGVVGVLVGHALAHAAGIPNTRDFKKISEQERSDLALVLETLDRKLDHIRDEIAILTEEVCMMSDVNPNTTTTASLDQAVADLDAASTAKIAEDQVLVADAKQGLNAAADIAKVETIVGTLNAETAAEQALTNPTPAPVATSVVAPVATAPASVVTPAGQINPIPGVTVVDR